MRMNGRNRKSSPHVSLGRRENPNGQLRSTPSPHPTPGQCQGRQRAPASGLFARQGPEWALQADGPLPLPSPGMKVAP